jgi:hypothetical protein
VTGNVCLVAGEAPGDGRSIDLGAFEMTVKQARVPIEHARYLAEHSRPNLV